MSFGPPPQNFIEWWIQKSKAVGRSPDDASGLVIALIQLNFAGIRSTGLGVMQSLVDIVVHPDYTVPLCTELHQARSAATSNDKQEDLLLVPPLAKLEENGLTLLGESSLRSVLLFMFCCYRDACGFRIDQINS